MFNDKRFPPADHAPFIIVLVLAAVLRLWDLGGKSLWRDEIETMIFSLPSWGEIIRRALEMPFIPRPPFYYMVTHYFVAASATPFALRLLPALSSLAALVLLYLLARRWFGRTTALTASFLMAVSPFQIHYAQEGREYAFLMALSLAGLAFLELSFLRSARWLWAWAVVSVATLYTHHFGVLVVGSQWLTALVIHLAAPRESPDRRRSFPRVFGAVTLLIPLCWLPMLLHFLSGLTGPRGMQGVALIPMFSREDIRVMAGLTSLGDGPGASVTVLLLAVLGFLTAKRRSLRGLLMALGTLGPVILLMAFGQFAHAFRVRYLIFAVPLYILMTARGADALDGLAGGFPPARGRRLPVFSIALAVAAVVWTYPYLMSYYVADKQNWKAAAAFIADHRAEGDLVVVSGKDKENNIRQFVLDQYADLGPHSVVLQRDDEYETNLRALLTGTRTLWFTRTYSNWPPPGQSPYPFFQAPEILREKGYVELAPIFFGTGTLLSPLEAYYLAPCGYNSVVVFPIVPDRFTNDGYYRESLRLLEEARAIPGSFVNVEPTRSFLRDRGYGK